MSVDREFVLRQARWIPSNDAEDAVQKIQAALGDEAAATVDAALRSEVGESSPLTARAESIALEAGADATRLRAALAQLQYEADIVAAHALRAYRGLLAYVSLLGGIMLAVLLLFVQAVLPQFESLYGGFGHHLPHLTAFVVGALGNIVLLAVPILIVVGLWIIALSARRILRLRRMPGGWTFLVPIVGSPLHAFRDWLRATLVDALVSAGLAHDDAISASAEVVGARKSATARKMDACLAAASKLDTFDQELEFWRAQLETEMLTRLVRARDILGVTVQLLLGLVVALLVIAVYLPIFSLGSAL